MSASNITQVQSHRDYRPSGSQIFILIYTFREQPRGYYGFVIKTHRGDLSADHGGVAHRRLCRLGVVCNAILDAFGRVEEGARSRVTLFTEVKNLAARIRKGCVCADLGCYRIVREAGRVIEQVTVEVISPEDNSQARELARRTRIAEMIANATAPGPGIQGNKKVQ